MSHTRSHTVSSILSPGLAAAALMVLLSACTPTPTNTDQNSSVSMDGDTSSSMMMDSSSSAMTDGTQSSSGEAAATQIYTDGTFSATGGYRSPAGPETIEVSLTLKDDVITDATVIGDATHTKSMMMQGKFIAGFKQEVVGKSIDSLSLGVVNGSSLTPLGFMDAVAKIKVEAKA